MTANEITAKIKQLRCKNGRDEWEQDLDGGAVLHVRCEPEHYSGVFYRNYSGVFYRIWATKRNQILEMQFAITSETAGKKARSLITKFQRTDKKRPRQNDQCPASAATTRGHPADRPCDGHCLTTRNRYSLQGAKPK